MRLSMGCLTSHFCIKRSMNSKNLAALFLLSLEIWMAWSNASFSISSLRRLAKWVGVRWTGNDAFKKMEDDESDRISIDGIENPFQILASSRTFPANHNFQKFSIRRWDLCYIRSKSLLSVRMSWSAMAEISSFLSRSGGLYGMTFRRSISLSEFAFSTHFSKFSWVATIKRKSHFVKRVPPTFRLFLF